MTVNIIELPIVRVSMPKKKYAYKDGKGNTVVLRVSNEDHFIQTHETY